jgi:hypothetical protein
MEQGNQFSSMKNQMTISANMIVSVFAMFGIGYYAGTQMAPNNKTVVSLMLAYDLFDVCFVY